MELITLYDAGNSNLGLCDNQGGWDMVRDGREVQERGAYVYLWRIHVDVWQKPTQYCKAIVSQLKINKCFKNAKKHHNPDVMVLGGADYGRCLDHEGSWD